MNVELFGKTSRQIFPHLFLVRWRNFRKKKYRLYLKNKIKSVHDNNKKVLCFIGGGNRSARRKSPTYRKSLTNCIT